MLLRIRHTPVFRQNDWIRILIAIRVRTLRINQDTLALRSQLLAALACEFLHAMQHRLFGQDGTVYLVKTLHHVKCFH
ncbi:hypothetical protein [Rhodanobacter umsongensis]